jgi:hypothetical protein
MSNVLIGIIGVILFIGLALAGALILGDDFRTASSSAQAAAVVSQIQQTQSAIEMWRLKTGQQTVYTQDTTFLVPRFLKTPALNPTTFGRNNPGRYSAGVHMNNDLDLNQDNENKLSVAKWVMAEIGQDGDSKARDTCQAIEEGQGRTTITSDRYPTHTVGCSDVGGSYVAYGTF